MSESERDGLIGLSQLVWRGYGGHCVWVRGGEWVTADKLVVRGRRVGCLEVFGDLHGRHGLSWLAALQPVFALCHAPSSPPELSGACQNRSETLTSGVHQ